MLVKCYMNVCGSYTHSFFEMQKFITQLLSQAEEYAGRYNLKVYDVTMRKERTGNVLRISLDGKVDLDSCAEISRLVSAWLDEHEDLIPVSRYTLEVSSLGLDRPLRTSDEFLSQLGKLCRITTKEKDPSGRKRYKGRIKEVTADSVTIYSDEESAFFNLPLANISKANIEIEL